ncbi:MAG TPA: TolC family protein [Opitutaceae bacterium]|nr:TolC family protein [Opitutaceae bacterium]
MLSSGFRSMHGGRRALLRLVWLFAVVGVRADQTEVAGTMPEDYLPALKTILQNAWGRAPRSLESELDMLQAEARRDMMNADRLPHFGGWADLARNQSAVSGSSSSESRDTGLFYRLELDQSLFHWGELKNKSAIGRLGVLMAEKNYAEAARQLAVTLRQSYLELVVKKMRLKQARAALELATDDLKLAQERAAHGEIAPGDMAGRELSFREQSLQVATVEEEFAAARRSFARVAGLKELPESEVADEIPAPKYSEATTQAILAGFMRDGGKTAFEAEINSMRATEADLNYRIARVKLLPKLDALLSHSLQNSTNVSGNSVTQTGISTDTIGLHVGWSIFDGFYSRGEKRSALADRRRYEQRSERAAAEALDRAQNLTRRLGFDLQAMDFAQAHVNIAKASQEQLEAELPRGTVSPSMIGATKVSRYQAEADRASMRANFFGRWSELVSLAGLDPAINTLPARYVRNKP